LERELDGARSQLKGMAEQNSILSDHKEIWTGNKGRLEGRIIDLEAQLQRLDDEISRQRVLLQGKLRDTSS
jgi:hypothetical protein